MTNVPAKPEHLMFGRIMWMTCTIPFAMWVFFGLAYSMWKAGLIR